MITLISSLLFGALLIGFGLLIEKLLLVFFHFKKTWRTVLFGSFLAFSFISFQAGLISVYLYFNNLVCAAILINTALLSILLYYWAKRNEFVTEEKVKEVMKTGKVSLLQKGLIAVFIILISIGFYLLSLSQVNLAVFSPWQVINSQYIYVFILATFVLGVLIHLRLPVTYSLVLLMLLVLLQHSYLPLTNKLLYGADGWRHISAEQRLLDGQVIIPPIISDTTIITKLTSTIGHFAYSQLWGTSVLLSKILSVSLININRWLLPIMWSIVFPVIIFEIARSFGRGIRRSLFLVWLSLLPFAFQVAGSFSLPVNFSFLFWLASLLLIFRRSENPERGQLSIILFFGIILTFGYTLFAILFWISFLVFEFIKIRMEFTWIEVALLILGVFMFLPILEWQFGYSNFSDNLAIWDSIKQLIGNFSSYYLSFGPRSHDITSGNIIFNQIPSYGFVVNFFTNHLEWLFGASVLFWSVFIYGLYIVIIRGFRSFADLPGNERVNIFRNQYCWIFVFGVGILLSYIFGRYFLGGEHLLIRRLDVVLAFIILIIFYSAFYKINFEVKHPWLSVFVLAFISILIGVSYSLGPDTKNVSLDEYRAAEYVAVQETSVLNHCIIAETYPLLALEAISKGKIIGGGFPISHNFEQPELSKLQINLKDISIVDVHAALSLTGAKNCWLFTKTNGPISYYIKTGNSTSTQFGDITVWNYTN